MHLQDVQRAIVYSYGLDFLDEEEAILLYDANNYKNPKFPYHEYERFDLDLLCDDESNAEFRFFKTELRTLCNQLGLPQTIQTPNRQCFSGIESLCVLLKRLTYPCHYSDLIPRFGRSVPDLANCFNFTLDFIYNRWGHLLSNFNQPFLSQQCLEEYCLKIAQSGAPLINCWGFIDGTVRQICRPGQDQKVCYNGHKRVHALKFQSILTPNGLIANLYGPVQGNRHDAGILRDAATLNELSQFSFDRRGEPLCIYGDPAYPLNVHLQMGFKAPVNPAQQQFNAEMSAVRVAVEWGFGKVIELFKFIDFKKNLKLHLSPVGKLYVVAVLLTNAHTCFYGSQVSDYFDEEAPALENYFQ